jgi:hypothetical protein
MSETIFRIISWIPNWLYADNTPRYMIVRALLGLILILIIIAAITVWPGPALLRRRHREADTKIGAPD